MLKRTPVLLNRIFLQRLTAEVDRLKAEKETLETKMSEYTFEGSSCSGRSDQEWTGLHNRLKVTFLLMSFRFMACFFPPKNLAHFFQIWKILTQNFFMRRCLISDFYYTKSSSFMHSRSFYSFVAMSSEEILFQTIIFPSFPPYASIFHLPVL